MYRKISAVLFPVLALVLIGTAFWGYQVSEERNVVLTKAENQYQRAFHNLSYHVEQLQTELGNSLAVNPKSQSFQRKCLLNVWRITSEAQNEIGQLPLGLISFSKTEEFLAKMSSFSYRTGVRDMKEEPLTEDEVNTLKTLYQHSKEISSEIRTLQSEVLDNQIRWMDIEMALEDEGEGLDNSVVNGFETIDKKVSEYSEVQWGPSTVNIFETRSYQKLDGKEVTAQQVKEQAVKFLNLKDSSAVKVVENGRGTEYASYSVTVNQKDNENNIKMDFTKKGGKLIWYMDSRNVNKKKLSIDQASDKAKAFLEDHDYKDMQAVSYDEYQNVANITFARVQDDIIIYPEKIAVKVGLDNGKITGMQASDYVYEHQERQFEKPKLSAKEAKEILNPNFEVQSRSMALIQNDLKDQVLCYEYLGAINDQRYRLYINADTGIEEKLEVIRDVDAKLDRNQQ
jgi:spore germination protein